VFGVKRRVYCVGGEKTAEERTPGLSELLRRILAHTHTPCTVYDYAYTWPSLRHTSKTSLVCLQYFYVCVPSVYVCSIKWLTCVHAITTDVQDIIDDGRVFERQNAVDNAVYIIGPTYRYHERR